MTASIYTKGTTTERAKTAKIAIGDLLLTQDRAGHDGECTDAQTKTGSIVREVAGVVSALAGRSGMSQRAQRRYQITFTDGTVAQNLAPIQTWHRVVIAEPVVVGTVTAEDIEYVAGAIERVQAEAAAEAAVIAEEEARQAELAEELAAVQADEEPALTQAECEALDRAAGTEETEVAEEVAAKPAVREGGVHAACDHENTSAGRRACRRARRKAGLPQLADAR